LTGEKLFGSERADSRKQTAYFYLLLVAETLVPCVAARVVACGKALRRIGRSRGNISQVHEDGCDSGIGVRRDVLLQVYRERPI